VGADPTTKNGNRTIKSDQLKKEFVDCFTRGELVFFSGSGISLDSAIPSASRILKETADVFLPSKSDVKLMGLDPRTVMPWQNSLISEIQPEILYERLLEITNGSNDCLSLWETICPSKWATFNGSQTPSIAHYAIVDYSSRNHKPLLTTNFDLLFEKAAETLKHKYSVIIPRKGFCKEKNTNPLKIFKIHGTISKSVKTASTDKPDSRTLSSLMITMCDISKANFELIEEFRKIMHDNYLAIVGYSGRDIDIYPFIRDILKEADSKGAFWINEFSNKKTTDYKHASGLSKTNIIGFYPKDLFATIEPLFSLRRYLEVNKIAAPPLGKAELFSNDFEQLLAETKKQMRIRFNWGPTDKLLFLGHLLTDRRMFSQGQFILSSIQASKMKSDSISPLQKVCLLRDICSNAHNLCSYVQMRRAAKDLVELSQSRPEEYMVYYEIIGRVYLAEYERMQVPFGSFVLNDLAIKMFRNELFKAYVFGTKTSTQIEELIRGRSLGKHLTINMRNVKRQHRVIAIKVQQELIEHRYRTLSIVALLLRDFLQLQGEKTGRFVRSFLQDEIKSIEKDSYKFGYPLGIVDCYKAYIRLVPPGQEQTQISHFMSNATHIIDLLNMETARDIFKQLEVESTIRLGELRGLRLLPKKLSTLYQRSLNKGNKLNALKALLAVAECNRISSTKHWSFRNGFHINGKDYYAKAKRLVEGLKRDAPLWKRYFEELDANYI
jgi:hypothetical protein